LYSVTDSYKRNGVKLGYPNSQTTLFNFCEQFALLDIEEQTPSAKEFYEEQRNKRIGPPRIEERNEQLEQIEKELEEEQNYNWFHRRRKKRSNQLKDWLYQRDMSLGYIVHGSGKCKCCTPPDIVKRNEEIWEQKWNEIQKQINLAKKEHNKDQGHKDRWDREQENFVKWQLKWGFL
jgi:hypothetical protein